MVKRFNNHVEQLIMCNTVYKIVDSPLREFSEMNLFETDSIVAKYAAALLGYYTISEDHAIFTLPV